MNGIKGISKPEKFSRKEKQNPLLKYAVSSLKGPYFCKHVNQSLFLCMADYKFEKLSILLGFLFL